MTQRQMTTWEWIASIVTILSFSTVLVAGYDVYKALQEIKRNPPPYCVKWNDSSAQK